MIGKFLKGFASLLVVGVILLPAVSFTSQTAFADEPAPPPANVKCIVCHENLYFLHDTGNWFCLKEAPMSCVDCHGGNPNTLDKNLAHVQRSAHPVINDDVSKCRQCHPQECDERVAYFDANAGISKVKIAVPYTPAYSLEKVAPLPAEPAGQGWLAVWEVVPLLLVAGLALAVHFLLQQRQKPQ